MATKQIRADERPTSRADTSPRTLAWLARSIESELAGHDLSLPQYRLLSFLDRGEWAASVLAERMSVSRPSMTSLADGLVTRGFVERRPSKEDRRQVLHVLTADGHKVLAAADCQLSARINTLVDRLEPDRRDAALDGLAALTEALDLARREAYGR